MRLKRPEPPRFDTRLDLGTVEGVLFGVEEVMESVRLRRMSPREAADLAKLLSVAQGVVASRDRTRAMVTVRGGGPPVRGVGVSSPFAALPMRGAAVRALPPPSPSSFSHPFGHPVDEGAGVDDADAGAGAGDGEGGGEGKSDGKGEGEEGVDG